MTATRERLVPDLWICPPDAPQFDENEVYGYGALLVAEVVSPASRHRDLVEKAQADAAKALAIPDPFGIELDVKSLLDR